MNIQGNICIPSGSDIVSSGGLPTATKIKHAVQNGIAIKVMATPLKRSSNCNLLWIIHNV